MTIFRFGRGFHHHGPFHLLLLTVLVVLVVAGAIALSHRWRRTPSRTADVAWNPPSSPWQVSGAPVDPALAELRMRFARGELNFEEYSERAARLGYGFPPETGPDVGAGGAAAP